MSLTTATTRCISTHRWLHSDEEERDVINDDGGLVVEVDTQVNTLDVRQCPATDGARRTAVINRQPVAIPLNPLSCAPFVVIQLSMNGWCRRPLSRLWPPWVILTAVADQVVPVTPTIQRAPVYTTQQGSNAASFFEWTADNLLYQPRLYGHKRLCLLSENTCHIVEVGWCDSAIGRASDLRFTGRRFESWLGTIA